MASPDTQPWVYNFDHSYYENFYFNRLRQMSQAGSFYAMWEDAWNPHDSLTSVGGTLVNNGVDITYYVHKHYNGDTPMCLTEKLVREIERIMEEPIIKYSVIGYITLLIVAAVVKFISKIFGSFIVTATMNTLDHECAKEFIEKLKEYRDASMTSKEAKTMLRYYKVLGPKVVEAIEEDKHRDNVYQYIYAEYLSKLNKLIDKDDKFQVFHIYFCMMDDMLDRYQIKTSERFVTWRQQIQY